MRLSEINDVNQSYMSVFEDKSHVSSGKKTINTMNFGLKHTKSVRSNEVMFNRSSFKN